MATANIYPAETGARTTTVTTGPYASSSSVYDGRLCCMCQHRRAYTNRFPTCKQCYDAGKAPQAAREAASREATPPATTGCQVNQGEVVEAPAAGGPAATRTQQGAAVEAPVAGGSAAARAPQG